MPHFIRIALAGLLAGILLAAGGAHALAASTPGTQACPAPDAAPSDTGSAAAADSTLCLLNVERSRRHLAPLRRNAQLDVAAARQARDMVARSYFAHETPEGVQSTERIRAAGYLRSAIEWVVGENLAWGTGHLATPGEIVAAWMASPGHRANILRPRYRDIGLGIAGGNPRRSDGAGATYATTFGFRAAPSQRGRSARRARASAPRRAATARR